MWLIIIIFLFSGKYLYSLEGQIKNSNQAYYHYAQGLAYIRSGDIAQAEREFEKTIELDPDAVSAYKELLVIYLNTGKTDKLKKTIKRFEKLQCLDTDTKLFIGGMYAVLKDTASAIEIYNEILEKESSNKIALSLLGEIYLNIDPGKSIEYWKKYIELEPQSSLGYYNTGLAYLKLDKVDKAEEFIEEAIQTEPDNPAPRMALAQIYEFKNVFIKAAEQYLEIARIQGDEYLTKIKAGSLYFISKNFENAEKVFSEVLSKYPDDPAVCLWLSLIYEEKKDFRTAIKFLKKNIEKQPSVEAYIRLSYYHSQLKQNDMAVRCLKEAVKLNRKNPEPYFLLGLSELDEKRYKGAEKYFKKVLELDRNYKDAYFYLGVTFERSGKFEKSEPYFRKVIELDPKNANALNYLGYSYADRNINIDEAEKLIKKALEIEPENPAFIDSLGWVYYRKGMYKESMDELTKAAQKTEDPEIYEHLGEVSIKLGKFKDALKYYRKAQSLDSSNPRIIERIKNIMLGVIEE